MVDALKEKVASLPDSPGIYRFYNQDDILIYVGKAKGLRKRVASYFSKQSSHPRKTQKLVSEIRRLEFTLANTEFDALLLENNFIKQYQPKYNILLKDDKTFPYLCILKERFPRIIYTRKYNPSQGEYFGPYSSVVSMKSVLELVQKLYSIRTCTFLLSEGNIQKNKFKVCLEFHLGNCKGPCEGRQQESQYLEEIALARNILKGNLSLVERHLLANMQKHADALEFERAGQLKRKLELLENFQAKSAIVNRRLTDIDVVTITSSQQEAFVNFIQVKEGAIVFSRNITVKKKLDESDQEILTLVACQVRTETHSSHAMVYSNIPLLVTDKSFENYIPQIGDKKQLTDLSLKNALYQKARRETTQREAGNRNKEALHALQTALRLQSEPTLIECFDNSNLQGSNPVASMVRFTNGKPDRANYRHFNVKTVTGADDFASMKEIVGRRYRRLLAEQAVLPDLIIVDGGKGQLSSAVEALKELQLYGQIPIIGIAKKLEEIYYPDDPVPLHISKKSLALLLVQHIRDEAHRFAVQFHRKKRSQKTIFSEVEQIPGIGKNTTDKLLSRFKSLKKIRVASLEELEGLIGKSKAQKVKSWQQKKEG
ncbi:MAG: excinuclease ABC subunit UvrC [Cytophagales bacterium]|nr:excinuclease ABC subunit UvrC [Cytophagales bacterium]